MRSMAGTPCPESPVSVPSGASRCLENTRKSVCLVTDARGRARAVLVGVRDHEHLELPVDALLEERGDVRTSATGRPASSAPAVDDDLGALWALDVAQRR